MFFWLDLNQNGAKDDAKFSKAFNLAMKIKAEQFIIQIFLTKLHMSM